MINSANPDSHKVLIKNFDTRRWSVSTVSEVLTSKSQFHKPLELVRSSDEASIQVLEFMAEEMNKGKKSETFWIRHAGREVESGNRRDYAAMIVALQRKCPFA